VFWNLITLARRVAVLEQERELDSARIINLQAQGEVMASKIEDAVTRIEASHAAALALMTETVNTLRELAELARAGAGLNELEARLNAAADALNAGTAGLGAAETETDPTP
jgi:hypothetical protein